MNRQALSTGCGALAANSTTGYPYTVPVPSGDGGITTGGSEAVVESYINSVMMSMEPAPNAAKTVSHSTLTANTPTRDEPDQSQDQSRRSSSSDFDIAISLSKMQAPAVRVRGLSSATSQVAAKNR